jgi:5'-deoxynucleotidase YfbR-like HD superfamily hydrolase
MSKLEHMKDKREKPTLKATIEENLQKVYQELLQEEVPDRFKQLLAELRQRQSAPSDAEDGK